MRNPNRELLLSAARVLQPLADELVFVGGCTTGLMITDPAAADIRSTYDVDAIAEVTSYSEYVALGKRLRGLGFSEDITAGAPICRWQHTKRIVLDVMPMDEKILGFSNPWYPDAVRSASRRELEPGVAIRVVSPPYFCATKLVAFRGRGRGDYTASHDLEDFIVVVDGREELVGEIGAAKTDVRVSIASEVRTLLRTRAFLDALPGYLMPDAASQARHGLLLSRLRAIASL